MIVIDLMFFGDYVHLPDDKYKPYAVAHITYHQTSEPARTESRSPDHNSTNMFFFFSLLLPVSFPLEIRQFVRPRLVDLLDFGYFEY